MTNFDVEIYERRLELARRGAKESLVGFTRAMWAVIEPHTVYKHNWHIDAIADHLCAVSAFDIKKLVIMVPPRHMKSLTASVMWPSWEWARNIECASKRFIFSTYAQSLSLQDAKKSRDILKSQKYKDYFRPQWTFKEDQDTMANFANSVAGQRISTSVDGVTTGLGGDYIVGDDLINVKEAASEVMRISATDHWLKTMSTRINNPEKSARVLIMQRLHENDPAGEWIKQFKDVYYLRLPAEYDPKLISFSPLAWKDPRTEEKQLLWPEHYNKESLENLKQSLGSMDSSAQLQQDPKPADGGLFKRKWWKRYTWLPGTPDMPAFLEIVQFWDCASKPGVSNDYSVCATWGRTVDAYYLLDIWREKVEMPQLQAAMQANYMKWRPSAVVIEDKSAGIGALQTLQQTSPIPVIPYDPGQRDKIVRATAATPTVEAGKCHLPTASAYVEDFISEHEKFPLGAHDDQVDTTSMMREYFSKRMQSNPQVRTL